MPVLNAQLQSILSLADYAQLNQDPGAAQLSERLLQTADTLFDDFDTGAWSLYSLGGAESPLNYHVFDTNLLKRIATQTQSPVWTARGDRFDRYLTAPPGLSAAGPKKPVKKDGPDLDLGVEDLARERDDRRLDLVDDVLARCHTFYWSARGRRGGPLLGARRRDRSGREQGVHGLPADRPEIASSGGLGGILPVSPERAARPVAHVLSRGRRPRLRPLPASVATNHAARPGDEQHPADPSYP